MVAGSRRELFGLLRLWTIVGLAVVSTVLAYKIVDRLERERVDLAFHNVSTNLTLRFQRTCQGIVDGLHSVHELMDVTPMVDRRRFADFVRPMLVSHPMVSTVAWVPLVHARDRVIFEQRARREGFELNITQINARGETVSVAEAEEYYPIFYVEPRTGNESAIGLDLAAQADRRAALYEARDTGLAAVAGPLRLVQDPDDASGYLVVLPNYLLGESTGSGNSRREHFAGAVLAVVQVSKILGASMVGTSDFLLEVVVVDRQRVVASSGGATAEAADPIETTGYASVELPIELAGRDFRLKVRQTPQFLAAHRTQMPQVVAAGGCAVSAILALYLLALRREHRARAHAGKALRESEHRYHALVENAPEAVVVYDADSGCFVDANAPVEAVLNVSRERLLASRPTDFSPRLQPDGRESSAVLEEIVGRALLGETVVAPWNRVDDDGNETPLELRLTRLPYTRRNLVRCSMIDVRERRQSELRQLTMAHELDHRVKNTLAMVLSIAEQTCASARSIEEFREAFVGRIRALARAHEALAARSWHSVPLAELAHLTFQPYVADTSDRAAVRGTSVRLSPAASSCPGMALHELAANAAKYGALSDTKGRVDLHWAASGDGDLAIEWTESAGRRVVPPTTAGFGSRLLKGVLSHELGGHVTLEYRPWGVHCRMTIPGEHWTVEGASGA